MAYCILILLGKTIQKLVFGELRASERQHLKDKFWNFVFYKFIFVFGVLNVQYMDEVVLWWAWFTALGFLSLLSQLCKDRFEYVSVLKILDSPGSNTIETINLHGRSVSRSNREQAVFDLINLVTLNGRNTPVKLLPVGLTRGTIPLIAR